MAAKDKNQFDLDAEFDAGIDVSQLSEQEKAIYDKLNAQVRKAYLDKTSKVAAWRKEQEKQLADLTSQHDEATKALNAWQQWYETEGKFMTPAQQRQAMSEEGLENPNLVQQEIAALRQEFQKAAGTYNTVIQELQKELGTTRQALGLSTQINDLRFKHPDIDPMRVLDTAKERGIQDLELAYNLAYGDELRTKQVNEEVEKRLTEERAKAAAEKDVIDTTPSTTRYAPPAEAKSYGEASKNILGAVRASGGGGTFTE